MRRKRKENKKNNLRAKLGMTQFDYSSLLGVSTSALNMFERNERRLAPSPAELHRYIEKCILKNQEDEAMRMEAVLLDDSENFEELKKLQKEKEINLIKAAGANKKLMKRYEDCMDSIKLLSKINPAGIDDVHTEAKRMLKNQFAFLKNKMSTFNVKMRIESAMRLAAAEAELKVISEAIAEAEKILRKS